MVDQEPALGSVFEIYAPDLPGFGASPLVARAARQLLARTILDDLHAVATPSLLIWDGATASRRSR